MFDRFCLLGCYQSVPGGFNALQRIYREMEEPMLNATREQFAPNPFAALINNNNNPTANRELTLFRQIWKEFGG